MVWVSPVQKVRTRLYGYSSNNLIPISEPFAVLGPVHPSQLGHTLSHEHILIDGSQFFTRPEYGSHDMEELDFDLSNLGKIRQYP